MAEPSFEELALANQLGTDAVAERLPRRLSGSRERYGERFCDVSDLVRLDGARPCEVFDEPRRPHHVDGSDLQRPAEDPGPVLPDEAEHAPDLDRFGDSGPDLEDLTLGSVHQSGAIAAVHIEPVIDAVPGPDVTDLDATLVVFGVDHEHSGGGDGDVVDVRLRAWNAPIVQNVHGLGQRGEAPAEQLLPRRAVSPRPDPLRRRADHRLRPEERGDPAEERARLQDLIPPDSILRHRTLLLAALTSAPALELSSGRRSRQATADNLRLLGGQALSARYRNDIACWAAASIGVGRAGARQAGRSLCLGGPQDDRASGEVLAASRAKAGPAESERARAHGEEIGSAQPVLSYCDSAALPEIGRFTP